MSSPGPGSDDAGVPEGAVWTIVVAAGSGRRFGGEKQFAELDGLRVVDHAVATALAAGAGCVLVVPASAVAATVAPHGVAVVAGGATRAESVRAGLAAVPSDADVICVHDAARPLASAALFAAVVAAVRNGADGAVPGLAVTDTIKVVETPLGAGAPPAIVATPERATLVAVQTPQAFAAAALRGAHAGGAEATDDAALVEAAGGRVVVVPGEADNRKLTHPDDLAWAAAVIAAAGTTAGEATAVEVGR